MPGGRLWRRPWAPSPGSTALGQLLALTRSKLSPKQLFATLGVYAFVSAAIGLLILLVTTRIPLRAVGNAIAWTPVALAGNAVGVAAA